MRRFFRVVLLLTLTGIAGAQDVPAMQQLWAAIKSSLSGPNGQTYYETKLKDSALPFLHGTVLSASPKDKPLLVILAMSDKSTREVELRMQAALTGELPPGTEVIFEGVAIDFSPEPFRLMIFPQTIRVHKAAPK